MSFQRNYRLITYECNDRLIGLARDYLTPKFIYFLTTKPACRSLNRVQREREMERELSCLQCRHEEFTLYAETCYLCYDLENASHLHPLKFTWWSSLDWLQFNFNFNFLRKIFLDEVIFNSLNCFQ